MVVFFVNFRVIGDVEGGFDRSGHDLIGGAMGSGSSVGLCEISSNILILQWKNLRERKVLLKQSSTWRMIFVDNYL
jgi:hypothetical protein